jgi:hypothetical protein
MYNTIMSMSDLVYANLLLSLALAPALSSIYVMPMLIASERNGVVRQPSRLNPRPGLADLDKGPAAEIVDCAVGVLCLT